MSRFEGFVRDVFDPVGAPSHPVREPPTTVPVPGHSSSETEGVTVSLGGPDGPHRVWRRPQQPLSTRDRESPRVQGLQ